MNEQLKAEEIEALRAIYDDAFTTISEEQSTYKIIVSSDNGILNAELILTFPQDYPSNSPPVYEVRNMPWLSSEELSIVDENLQLIYKDSCGEVVVFQWVEWLKEWLTEHSATLRGSSPSIAATNNEVLESVEGDNGGPATVAQASPSSVTCPDILHGDPLTDRRSTFQAHLARVNTTLEVKVVISELKKNRKIATATHNIMAYRIYQSERGVYQQDCDDDGEAAAGGRLLHLLQIMDVRDVAVIVTRWYGGILLHADRFKHINNVARILIQDTGVGLEHKDGGSKTKKQSKINSKSKNTGAHR